MCAASEQVICAPEMLHARFFPDTGDTWQEEYKTNHKLDRLKLGTAADDDWWAERANEYVVMELKAELINCMEAFEKASGFRAPGTRMRRKRRKPNNVEDPANFSSGEEGDGGAEEVSEEAEEMLDDGGLPQLGGDCGSLWAGNSFMLCNAFLSENVWPN